MIEARHLSKNFGPIAAVKDISLAVREGEVLGFLGPNGAGKTTTMKMLTGFLAPSAGDIEICGIDLLENPLKAQEKIGYLPEGAPLYGEMTPKTFLEFTGTARGLTGKDLEKAIDRVVREIHLKTVLSQAIETLSKGYCRRVALAQALLHDPRVLILDEPTDGLDPNQKNEVRRLLKGFAGEKAIIISTHILEEVETMCSRTVVINRGELVADGTPQELRTRSRYHNAVLLTVPEKGHKDIAKGLRSLASVRAVEISKDGEDILICALAKKGKAPFHDVHKLADRKKWPIRGIHADPGRLDDVFRSLTGKGKRKAA